jgi:arylsulfatase A-like enzyme
MPRLHAWTTREAVTYPRAVSVAPWTLPAHGSLFTGHYPSVHGAHELRHRFEPSLPTMAEWFSQHGYRTCAVSANAWISPDVGFGRGFHEFRRVWQLVQVDTELAQLLKQSQHLSKGSKALRVLATGRPSDIANAAFGYARKRLRHGDYRAGMVTREALRLAAELRSDPMLLFVNYMEAHAPYWGKRRHRRRFLPPGTSSWSARRIPQSSSRVNAGVARLGVQDRTVLRALYQSEIRYLDEQVEQLLDGLAQRRGLDNATVVVLSDHGENIGDHGLLGHNYSLWETLLHVPLIIRFPGGDGGGSYDDRLAQTVDVLPTLVQAVGGDALGDRTAGRDLRHAAARELAVAEYLAPMPSIEIMRRKYPNACLDHFDRSLRALRTADDEKLIWDSRGDHHLYDLVADPNETSNLTSERPDRVHELIGVLTGWAAEHAPGASALTAPGTLDGAVRRQLEAMGYL